MNCKFRTLQLNKFHNVNPPHPLLVPGRYEESVEDSLMSWIQSVSTGGGTGVDTVLIVVSEMMLSASFVAWYMRRISSR